MNDNKRIAKNTLAMYIRMLLTMLISLYTSRVILHALGVIDFGIYNVVGGVIAIASVLNSALTTTTQRFITIKLKSNLAQTFSCSLTVHVIISIISFALLETIGLWFFKTHIVIPPDRILAATWVYHCAAISSVIQILTVPYNAVIIAHEKLTAYAYISIFDVVYKLLIAYFLLWGEYDKLIIYSILLTFSYFVVLLITLIYSKRICSNLPLRLGKNKYIIKEMIRLSVYTLYGSVSFMASTSGIAIILNLFLGPIANAASGISGQVKSIVYRFSQNFQTAINPQITKNYAEKDYQRMNSLIISSMKFSTLILLIMSLPFVFEGQYILEIWLTEVPQYSLSFLQITLFISIIDAIANPVYIAALANGNIKRFQLTVNTISLFILPIGYISLYLGFPPECVYYIKLLLSLIGLVASIYLLNKIVSIPIYTYINTLFSLTLVCIVSFIINYTICYYLEDGIGRAIIVIITTVCSISILSYYLCLTKVERSYIQNFIKTKIHKK